MRGIGSLWGVCRGCRGTCYEFGELVQGILRRRHYQVRLRQVWSFAEQRERIRPWISGGKERKGEMLDVDMALTGMCVWG